MQQWINIAKKLPEYFVSKIDPNEYFNIKIRPAYRADIFNEYGDSNAHWVLKKQGFDPDDFSKTKTLTQKNNNTPAIIQPRRLMPVIKQ